MDIDGGTVDVLDDDVCHIVRRLVLSHSSSNELTFTLVKISGTYVFIFPTQCGCHFGYGNVVGRKGIRVEDDLHLWLDATVDFRLSHARDPFKARLDEVLDELVLGFDAGVVTTKPLKDNPGNGVLLATGGDQHRLLSLVRIFRHLVEVVGDFEKGCVRVGAHLELKSHPAAAVKALAFHFDETFDALENVLLLVDDLPLHLLGAGSRPDGIHGDLGFVHIGCELHRNT